MCDAARGLADFLQGILLVAGIVASVYFFVRVMRQGGVLTALFDFVDAKRGVKIGLGIGLLVLLAAGFSLWGVFEYLETSCGGS